MIIRIRAEEMSEEVGVFGCIAGPPLPHLIAERISDELILRSFHHVVGTDVGRLGVRVLLGVHALRGQKTKVFPPEEATKGRGVMSGLEGLSVHGAVERVSVFHYNRELTVVDAELGLFRSAFVRHPQELTYAVVNI